MTRLIPGYVAAGPIEASDKAGAHRVYGANDFIGIAVVTAFAAVIAA